MNKLQRIEEMEKQLSALRAKVDPRNAIVTICQAANNTSRGK